MIVTLGIYFNPMNEDLHYFTSVFEKFNKGVSTSIEKSLHR